MDNKKGLVSIILLNCNGKRWNKDCIDSLLLQTYKNYEIVFVNNMSTDGSLEEVENIYKKEIDKGIIKIVLNSSNTGFTGGNNLGVKNSSKNSKYICLLNNDTTVSKSWLENLVNGIESDKNLGGIGSIILNKGQENFEKNLIFEEKQSIRMNMYGLFGFKNISDLEFKNNLFYTNFISGCCFLYKRDLFEVPFEDYYFIYNEDTFLSWRIINKGYKLGLCLNSFVNHYGGGAVTSKLIIKRNLYLNNRNKLINFLCFYPTLYLIVFSPLFILEELLSIFSGKMLLRLQTEISSFKWIIKNKKDIFLTKNKIRSERKIIFSNFLENFSHSLIDLKDALRKHNKIMFLFIPFMVIINFFFLAYYYILKLIFSIFKI